MRLQSWCISGNGAVSFSKDTYHKRQCHITSIYGSFHVRSGQYPPAWSGSMTVNKRDGLGSALYRGVGRSLQNTISRNAYQLERKPSNFIAKVYIGRYSSHF